VVTGPDATEVHLRYPIYADGLNRQTFLLAVRDITGTADSLREIAAPTPESTAEPPAAAEPESVFEPIAPAAEPEVQQPVTPAETVVVDRAPAWAPTHTVPGGGMSAWSEPDPALAPVATLQARVELRVDDQRGAWAKVTGSNGWTGWVDARKLRPIPGSTGAVTEVAASPAATPVRTAGLGGLTIRPVPVVGGIAMIVGSFLTWVGAIYDADAWDIGMGWLWQGTVDNPRLGVIMLVLGIAAIGLAFVPRAGAGAFAGIGLLGLIVTALFTFQVLRVLADWQWQVLWNGDIGAGWWIAFLGSIVAMVRGPVLR
jgi:hypothetical protein